MQPGTVDNTICVTASSSLLVGPTPGLFEPESASGGAARVNYTLERPK
ncbi:uncharacterized protein FPRO_14474 [Fusarium proliferatum ET1]|uniref:Uncharacterized protein n=1 Tax=Fusarium proliferatum (strain ET1) TaxID=1227346 RepID=A0A1L7VXP5_FUSPR|nr:uncharacterized protein FPRO_14474 [Fusarium proliferatum ET1]CZR44721.1 uncharacterized protein FPRO_14474 [Fusarium proliferatum ET1]